MNRSRRKLLLAGPALTGLGGLGLGLRFADHDGPALVDKILRRRLPQVRMAADQRQRFARDFCAVDPTSARDLALLEEVLALLESRWSAGLVSGRSRRHLQDFERRIVTAFVQATGMQLSERPQQLSYNGLHNPYARPCGNKLFLPAGPASTPDPDTPNPAGAAEFS